MPKRFKDLSQRQKNRRLLKRKKCDSYLCDAGNMLLLGNDDFVVLGNKDNNNVIDDNSEENISADNSDNSEIVNTNFENVTAVSQTIKKIVPLRSSLILWADENNIKQKSLTLLLNILRAEGHVELPSDGRTIMKTPRHTITTTKSGGKYFHYGLKEGIIDQLKRLANIDLKCKIFININIDGLPVSKSSNSQLWPILAQIVHDKLKTPFVVGAFHGYHKPTTNEHFLEQFTKEYEKLNTDGFNYNGEHYTVQIRAITCDAPARSFVTCTKGHNGYFGCSKCNIEGDYEKHRMLFLYENCPLRTDASFKSRLNPEHHTGISPFETIGIPMVSTFTLDYMHLVCLGQTKKMLRLWMSGPKDMGGRLSGQQIKKLSEDIVSIKQYVPYEFVRVPTNFEELDRWKATEFRLFLLYLGPILIDKYFPNHFFIHFVTFHCAIRILCHPQDYMKNNHYAKSLLLYFVTNFKTLYGTQNMIYTVHNLIHLSDDAARFGPLDSFSSFPFENHLHSIKKLIRKSDKPLQQIHRRIVEKQTATELKDKITAAQYPILMHEIHEEIPFGCSVSYDTIQFRNFKLTCSKKSDSVCYIKNKIISIKFIGLLQQKPVIIGNEFKNYESFPGYPCDSRKMDIFVVSNDFTELQVFAAENVKMKAVFLPWKDKFCALPLLHTDIVF